VTALSRAIRRDRRRLARAIAGARQGDADGVHDARVACRRLREALPSAAAAGRDPRRTDRALRKLMKTLGPVREADVTRAVLEATARTAEWPPAIVSRVDRTVRKRRDRAWAPVPAALDALHLDRVLEEVEEIGRAVARDGSNAAVARALAAHVRQRAAELARAIDHAGTLYVPEPLHVIRLAAKKLRYALELAPATAGWSSAPARRQLRHTQVLLGGLRDLQIVQAEVNRVAARLTPGPAALGTLGEMDREIEARCRKLHAAFLRAAPGLRTVASRLSRAVALGAVKPRPVRMTQAVAVRAAGASGGRR
jgi:CHAD domain-containing protein